MASAWGNSWGQFWGDSWGAIARHGVTFGLDWQRPVRKKRRRTDAERLAAVQRQTVELGSTPIAGAVIRIGSADRIVLPRLEVSRAALMRAADDAKALAAEFSRLAAARAVAKGLALAEADDEDAAIALLLSEIL